MLKTRLTTLFGLEYPILSAPMANHSGGRLAVAVSKAGGLGTFGGINPAGPEWVREQISHVRSNTDRPFGVGFITAFIPGFEANFQVCLDERVPVIVLSFGDATPYLKKAKDAGLLVVCQVQTVGGARAAVAAGADLLVAQGNEGGGHSGYLNTLPCLSLVLAAADGVPVLAAGGIGDGRTLAAVLAAGAEGAMLGTAFLATPECVEIPDVHKDLIVASDGQDTVHTQIYDILSGAPWPPGIGERLRANQVTAEWQGHEADLRSRREEVRATLEAGVRGRDPDVASVLYGQSAGMIGGVRPAAEVMVSLCDEAEKLLRRRLRELLP